MSGAMIAHSDGTFSDIEYSLVDGHVYRFECHGRVMYDEEAGIDEEGWLASMWVVVLTAGVDEDLAFIKQAKDALWRAHGLGEGVQ